MEYNNNGSARTFDRILASLGLEKAAASAGNIHPQQITFKNAAARDTYLQLAGVPADQQAAFPMEITVLTGSDITVTPSQPLVINPGTTSPVGVHFDTLTLETGGQIQCNTAVVMTVENFIKQ